MRYPKEVIEFVREVAQGKSSEEIAELLNIEFKDKGLQFTAKQASGIKSRNKIVSGRIRGTIYDRKYGPEFEQYVSEQAKGRTAEELTTLVNERFKCDISIDQVRSYKKRKKIKSGIDMKFKKRNIPWSKGKKTNFYSKSRFKKGHVPANKKPVGAEIVRDDGYHMVKVGETGNQHNDWRMKHIIEYEKHNGPVPEGHIVRFLDGNRDNITIDNLILIPRNVHTEMNIQKLNFEDKELTKIGVQIAKLNVAIIEKRKAKNESTV